MTRVRIAALAVGALIAIVSLAAAQTTTGATGAINGRVFDESKAVLPGVTVTIMSPSLIGGPRTTITSEDGVYRFPAVPPGEYAISMSCRASRQSGGKAFASRLALRQPWTSRLVSRRLPKP